MIDGKSRYDGVRCTYVEDLGNLNEVGVADDLMGCAHLKHDHFIRSSRQLRRHSSRLNELLAQNVEDRIEDELQKLDPIAFSDPAIDAVDACRDKVALIGLCAAFKSA